MNEPTYSQIEAALTEFSNRPITLSPHERMKRALIAAQKVDQNIYGHMHYGFSCDGVTLMTDSKESRDRIGGWYHDSTSTLPYHEKYTIPELKRRREEVTALTSMVQDRDNEIARLKSMLSG